jgi:hypothetical protein
VTAAERIEVFGAEALRRLAGTTLCDGAKLAYVLVFSHEGELPNEHLAMMMGLDENYAACFAEELEIEELIVRRGYGRTTRYALPEEVPPG